MEAPSLIFESGTELLEGPVFDRDNHLLYFVSILDFLVYRFDPATNEMLNVKLDSPVSCIFLLSKNTVLAASKNGFYEINFNTLQKKFVFQIDISSSVRYNDGIMDSEGRIIIGTMGYPEVKKNIGKVYSYQKGEYRIIIENTTISNGLAFSPDNTSLYFVDTPTMKVARYHYDIQSGEVMFDTYVIEFTGNGVPDGMCMDPEGMLWIAEWGGGCISRWNPLNGDKLQEKKLPCINVTSCCFDNFYNLYVTTAKSDSLSEQYGGSLFYIELN